MELSMKEWQLFFFGWSCSKNPTNPIRQKYLETTASRKQAWRIHWRTAQRMLLLDKCFLHLHRGIVYILKQAYQLPDCLVSLPLDDAEWLHPTNKMLSLPLCTLPSPQLHRHTSY